VRIYTVGSNQLEQQKATVHHEKLLKIRPFSPLPAAECKPIGDGWEETLEPNGKRPKHGETYRAGVTGSALCRTENTERIVSLGTIEPEVDKNRIFHAASVKSHPQNPRTATAESPGGAERSRKKGTAGRDRSGGAGGAHLEL